MVFSLLFLKRLVIICTMLMVFVFGRRIFFSFIPVALLPRGAALIRNATKNQNFGNKSSPAASLKFYIVTKGNRPKMRFGHNF